MNFKKLIKTLIITMMISVLSLPVIAMAEDQNADTVKTEAEENVKDTSDTARKIIKYANEPGTVANMMQLSAVFAGQLAEAELAAAQSAAAQPAAAAAGAYTEEDLYILAHVICGEAQSYSDEEQLYVGSVVLNRVHSASYPNTIKDVVFQRNQYSCTVDGNYHRTPTERNWANAKYLLENGSVLPGNVVFQSGHRQGKGVYVKTSRHYYCYQ